MKRRSIELLIDRMYGSEVERRRERGRSCTTWLDGVKKACNAGSLELSDAKVMSIDTEQWETL